MPKQPASQVLKKQRGSWLLGEKGTALDVKVKPAGGNTKTEGQILGLRQGEW